MSRDQGFGIPRWLTAANLAAVLVALAVVIPQQSHAASLQKPGGMQCFRVAATEPKPAWTDSDSVAQGFFLQRARNPDFKSGVVEFRIAKNTFDYIDETRTFGPSQYFYYRVVSYAGTTRSPASDSCTAINYAGTMPSAPKAPTSINVAPQGNGLNITWTLPSNSNETGIWVERSGDERTTWETRASLSLGSTSFFDSDPPAANPWYRIGTFNAAGEARGPYEFHYIGANAANVTGVASNANGVVSNVTGVASNINGIGSLVPGVQSQVATLASQAAGISSNLGGVVSLVPNAASIQASLNSQVAAVQSQANGIASNLGGLASLVPNAASVQASAQSQINALQSQATGIVSSIPDVNKLGIFIGAYNALGKAWVAGVWLWPPSCIGQSPGGPCLPPKPTTACADFVPGVQLQFQYCIVTDLDYSH